ncbi:MAG: hypothetical protein AB7G93_15480 [Bdellovibrionales bacterium]
MILAIFSSLLFTAHLNALELPTGCQVRLFVDVSNVSDPRDIFGDPGASYADLLIESFSKVDGFDLEKGPVTLQFRDKYRVDIWDNRGSANNPDTIGFAPRLAGGPHLAIGFVRAMGWFQGREAILFNDGTYDHVVDIYCWRAMRD